jgi:hypothetical protein
MPEWSYNLLIGIHSAFNLMTAVDGVKFRKSIGFWKVKLCNFWVPWIEKSGFFCVFWAHLLDKLGSFGIPETYTFSESLTGSDIIIVRTTQIYNTRRKSNDIT